MIFDATDFVFYVRKKIVWLFIRGVLSPFSLKYEMAVSIKPLWHPVLQKAMSVNRSAKHFKHVQLATVRPDGSPACRTIVFREFDDEYNFLFCTDLRSKKASEEIIHDRRCEICWYMTISREQFRVRGISELVGPDNTDANAQEKRLRIWRGMTDAAREQFGWPTPGEEREGNEPLYNGEPLSRDSNPLDTFLLLIVSPHEIDHLQLKGNRRFRYSRKRDAEAGEIIWEKVEVNP